jgi:cytochrome c oxidase assembly protein subunit 15
MSASIVTPVGTPSSTIRLQGVSIHFLSMNRPLSRLAWSATVATWLLIVLGGVVRITGSGLGCGDEWPICHGRLVPSFADIGTAIEWSHRLVAAIVSTLVLLLAGSVWWARRRTSPGPSRLAYAALGLLMVQVLLGAVTVKLQLPPWTIVLHLGTAMLLLATLLAEVVHLTPGALKGLPSVVSPGFLGSGNPPATGAAVLVFVTILMGALTANLGAATACVGFPLCNGQWIVTGNGLQYLQWTHRLLAYTTYAYLLAWALAARRRAALLVLGLATLQIVIAAVMVTADLPRLVQAAHVAVGAALWGTVVYVALGSDPPGVRP